MHRVQSAFIVGVCGLGLTGCVDEGAYNGPQRYEPPPRVYRQYDDRRYDPPPRYERYDRYDPPVYDRYEQRPPYDPYDRPPPRRYERYDRDRADYDRPRSYQPPVRDRDGYGRNPPPEQPQPTANRPPPLLPPPPQEYRPPQPAPQPPGRQPSRTTSTIMNQRSGLTQDCTGEGGDMKCSLRMNRPPPQ